MVEFLEPAAMKFIIFFAAVAAVVAIIDIVLLSRRRGTAQLKGLLPAIDSILVIAGFMAFVGTGVAFIGSASKIVMSNIQWESVFSEESHRYRDFLSRTEIHTLVRMVISAFVTAIIAWALFFFFFEVWYVLRFLCQKYMKKLPASS